MNNIINIYTHALQPANKLKDGFEESNSQMGQVLSEEMKKLVAKQGA